MRLSDALRIPRGITAAIGGGGKSTLLRMLADELTGQGTVLITTTTHIWAPAENLLTNPTRASIRHALTTTRLLTVGDPSPEGKLTAPRALNDDFTGLADYVLVEADGSRGLPLKAPAEHEPVLPAGTELVIAVAGMRCADMTIAKAAHRPERYASLTELAPDALVTPDAVARVLCHPEGQRKGVTGRFAVVLNQADTPERLAFARAVARLTPGDVWITALQTRPGWLEGWLDGKPIAPGMDKEGKPCWLC